MCKCPNCGSTAQVRKHGNNYTCGCGARFHKTTKKVVVYDGAGNPIKKVTCKVIEPS